MYIYIHIYILSLSVDVPGPLAGSKVLLVIVYNTALVSAIILSITQLTLNDVPLTILIQAVGISFCVVVNCALYVFPLVYTIHTIGDEHIYKYMYIYVYTHIFIYVYNYTYIYIDIYVYMYIHVHIYLYRYTYVYVYTCI
jgi:hypothetical protein